MEYLGPFIFACLLTFLITPVVIGIAKRFRLVDDPRIRHHPASVHTGIVPRAGGLALYTGVVISVLMFIGITNISLAIGISGLILTTIGLLDDRKDINPYIRLIAITVSAGLVVSSGVKIPYITDPISGGVLNLDTWSMQITFLGNNHTVMIWSVIFAFLWIMWTINIVGWSAGVDGQMPGFVAIAACTLGILALRFDQTVAANKDVPLLAFIVAGVFIGFLPWNYYPQKIMPGYGGKTLAGLLLGILGILSYGKVGTALLVLGIPTLDAAYTLLRRMISGKSPVWADRGHLHHQLLSIGWGKRRIALFYWFVSAILGAIALTVTSRQKLFLFLFISVAFGVFIVWVKFFMQFSKQHDRDNG